MILPIQVLAVVKSFCLLNIVLKIIRTIKVEQQAMRVLMLENCPSLITYNQVEKRRILEMQSNMVFISKNIKLSVVKEFFFARFLKTIQFHLSFIFKTYLITQKAQANEAKLNTMENIFQLNKSFQSKVPDTSVKLKIKDGVTYTV